MINSTHASIIGVRRIGGDAGKLIDRLRGEHKGVSIQAVNADAVYGADHLLAILRMTLEAEKRNVMIANKREIEWPLLCPSAFRIEINEFGAICTGLPAIRQVARYLQNYRIDNS